MKLDGVDEESDILGGEDELLAAATSSWFARWRDHGMARGRQGWAWLQQARDRVMAIDLAFRYYERDQEALATVLGSAMALRLYLFLIPTVAMFVGLAIVVLGKDQLDAMLSSASITGTLAQDVSSTADASVSAGIALFLVGLWLTAWAGHSLSRVMAASAGRSWRLDSKDSRATVMRVLTVTGLVLAMFAGSVALNRLRSEHGLAVVTTSWLLAGVMYAGAWFVVCWFMPRGTPDPGALLPGAAFMGLTLTGLQWFMQFYLPNSIEHATAYAGQLGLSMAMLGYLFLIGRLMAVSFALDAVLFERVGSVSQFVFALPLVRAIPRRYPAVGRFFDLPADPAP